MATQGIKLKDKNNNILLPATSGDLVEVKYGGTSRILSSLLEEIEETTADALSDLSDEVAAKADKAFIVHLTQEVNGETTTYSVDKTVAEMHAAAANGQSVYIAMQEGDTIQYSNISAIQPDAAVASWTYFNNLMEILLVDNNGSTVVDVSTLPIASEDFVHTLTDNKETKTTIKNVNSATISQSISSNKLYIFGSTTTPVTSFTLTGLTETESTPYVNKYHGFIYCGDDMSFTIPSTIKIANDQTLPLFSSGHLFEFSILNNILTFTYTTL